MSDSLAPKVGIELAHNQRLDWLRLIRSENVGAITFIELIKRYGTASNAIEALPELAERGRGRKKISIASIADVEQELARIADHGATTVCLGEPNYPPALRAIDDAPPVLVVHGSVDILRRNAIAFVGSRNSSIAGVKLTRQLATDVASAGYATISGLARGIDSAAHHATIEQGTIAVLAGGIDNIYPNENIDLAKAIVDNGGALITEMPFGWPPRSQDFPRRNRIVAGIALGLVVVEAAHRSGTLISARLANEMGRLVFAVPGSPLDPRNGGSNNLIKQGAQLITSAKDILDAMEPMIKTPDQSNYTLDEKDEDEFTIKADENDREKIISAMGHTPTDVDEIIRFTGVDAPTIQLIMLELHMAGRLERHQGNKVSLI